ncbi:MAG: hypothetical protein WD737_11835 [Gemmatimonadota bacterium]
MDRKTYEVEVISRQRVLYRIEADDAEAAERRASERWQNAQASDVPGIDWSELVAARTVPTSDPTRQAQDEELVLRFIRERERLLIRMGGDLLPASLNDAISAAQAAADLGWARREDGNGNSVDVIRAAQALERLCSTKRLVCFARTRVRSGERGEIRLYCTPEYLEQLSATLQPDPVG